MDAGETREFTMLHPYNFKELEADDWVYMHLQWKFAQPLIWQPERKMRVALQKRDFELLDGATFNDEND